MLDFFKGIYRKICQALNLNKSKKARIKRLLPALISTFAVLAVVLVTVYHSTDGFTTLVDIDYASIVSEKETMTFTAYMLRDEKVLSSQYSQGGVLYSVNDAERVDPGDELAKLYSQPVDKAIEEKAKMLDACIELLEESLGDGYFTLEDSTNVKAGIQSLYYSIMRAISSGDSATVSASAEDMLVLLNRMQVYAGNAEQLKSLLSKYKADREELQAYYNGEYSELLADEGGYFFSETDGYENIYTSSNIENLTYASFVEMTKQSPSTEQAVGKLLLNYRWYLAIPTVKGIADTYTVGDIYKVSFPDSENRSFDMTLSRVIYDASGSKGIMLFSCGIVDSDFHCLRIQTVNIVNRDITGFRIPESAVCEVDGTTGVYVLKDGRASFRKITVLYAGEGYYIVSADNSNSNGYYIYIELNDSIITDCKNMYEGKVIE